MRRTTIVVLTAICLCIVVERVLHARHVITSATKSELLSGSGYEWPFVWDAGTNLDPSGYDWLGSSYVGDPRGLQMPASHDVFGELQGGQNQVLEYDDLLPVGALPGGPLFDTQSSGSLRVISTSQPSAQLQSQGRIMQALAREYTDFSKNGDPIKCKCDTAAAGDEEMEGLYASVKPACTCTGGLATRTTRTEQGGPLDSGAYGAWPQGLPVESKIDGLSANAYRARPGQLLQVSGAGLFQSPVVDSPLHDVDNITAPCQVENPGCHKLGGKGLPVSRWPWDPARGRRPPAGERREAAGRTESLLLTGEPRDGGDAIWVAHAAAGSADLRHNPPAIPAPESPEGMENAAIAAFVKPWRSWSKGPDKMSPAEQVLRRTGVGALGEPGQAINPPEHRAVRQLMRAFSIFLAQTDKCSFLGPVCGEPAAGPAAPPAAPAAGAKHAEGASLAATAGRRAQALAGEVDHHLLLWPRKSTDLHVTMCPCKVHAIRHLCYQLRSVKPYCEWSETRNKVCDNPAVAAAEALCDKSAGINTKLPGVNIDEDPLDEYLSPGDAALGPDWPGQSGVGALGGTDRAYGAAADSDLYPAEGVHV